MSIILKNIWFKYHGMKKWVFKNISYEFRERKIYVIIGPNGSGKTTLLKIASLIYKPLKGSIFVWGKNFWKLKGREAFLLRRKIIYVHEKPILFHGTVHYNIAYGLILRGYSREDAYVRVENYMEKLGFSYLLSKDVDKLSTGEAQIVSLVRAFILEPKIIFLDEPLAHIDIKKRKIIINLISRFKEKAGIIIATHDMYLAHVLADEAILIEDGKIKTLKKEEIYPSFSQS